MSDKTSMSVRLDSALKIKLEEMAADRRRATGDVVTVADLIREALSEYVSKPAKAAKDRERYLAYAREKIASINEAQDMASMNYKHAYLYGWVGALAQSELFSMDDQNALTAEANTALKSWQ